MGMMVMSLLFIMLARFVIAFLPRSKHILISWLKSPSDLGAQENKVCRCFLFSPIYSSWNDGSRCHDLSFLNVEPNSTFFKTNQLVTLCISQRSSQSDDPNKLGDSRPGYWATWLQLWLKILQKKRIQDLHYSDPFKLPQTKRALIQGLSLFPREGAAHSWGASLLCSFFAWQRNKATLSLSPKTQPRGLTGRLGISLHVSLLQERGGLEDFSDRTRLPGTPCHRAMPQSHLTHWLGSRTSRLWWRTGKSLT